MGLAQLGAKKMPRQTAQGGWRSRNRDNVAERPSDAPGQRPQSLVLEDELDHHGNIYFVALRVQVKALHRFFSMRRHGAKNADYRGGVTCLYGTELLGACLHPCAMALLVLGSSGAGHRYQSPIQPQGPPERSGPQAQPGVGCRLGQPSLVLHQRLVSAFAQCFGLVSSVFGVGTSQDLGY